MEFEGVYIFFWDSSCDQIRARERETHAESEAFTNAINAGARCGNGVSRTTSWRGMVRWVGGWRLDATSIKVFTQCEKLE
jgi:hypothetical protein